MRQLPPRPKSFRNFTQEIRGRPVAFSLHGRGDNEFGPFLLERRPGQQPGDRSVFFRLLGSYPSSSLATAIVAVRLRLDRPRPLASDGPARPAQRQPCWGDDQADHQERGQNVGETHVTAPNDCVMLIVLQLMRRPAIELAPRHLPGRARAYRRQVARADRLVVVARDRALVALGRDRPDNRGRVDGPAKPSASINAQTGLFPQAECRPCCRAGCQDDRVFNVEPRRRTGYVDNSLPRVLAHSHCATTLSLRNPMADPKLDIGGP